MRQTVRKTISYYNMLAPGDNVLVGLSGGADSVALLYVLLELAEELGLGVISALHVNHNLRGAESDRDEAFVRGLATKLGVALTVKQAPVKELAKEKGLGLEEAGRELRYGYFYEWCSFHSSQSNKKSNGEKSSPFENCSFLTNQKIALGHNQNDTAETVIMNLCRGTGLKGLCGIPPVNDAVIRPLIETPRDEIEEYLNRHGILYITDETNAFDDYTRNRVRNLIIPALKDHVNTQAETIISRNANWLRADEEFLEDAAQEALADCLLPDIAVSVSIDKLTSLPLALSRRVIRLAISQARRDKKLTDITAVHITSVLDLAAGQTGREIHLPSLIAAKSYDRLIFTKNHDIPSKKMDTLPSETILADYAQNSREIAPSKPIHYLPNSNKAIALSHYPPDSSSPPDPLLPILYCTKSFECDIVTFPLILRSRRPGDRIIFQRETGELFTKKLQDYFTDKKTPKHQRNTIPLLAHGSDILWIMDKDNRTNAKYQAKDNKNQIWVSLWESEMNDKDE